MVEWKKYKVSDFIEINPTIKLVKGNPYSFVEMKDLSEGQKYVKPSQSKELKGGARFQNNDTLFARITPCLENGKICQVKNLKNDLGFGSTEFLVFRGKKDISDTDFVYYLSRSEIFRNFAEQNMVGTSGRQRVSKEVFSNLELSLPPLPTQTTIAEILSSLDDKIELNNQINQNLEALAQALFKQWYVDFEFPNENGEPYKFSGGEMVDSELGEIPKGWSVGAFGDLCKIINGYAFKSKDFKEHGENGIIKIRNVSGNIVDINNTQFVTNTVTSNVQDKFKVLSGDILIAMTGAEVGKIGVVPETKKSLWLNQRVGKLKPLINNSDIFIYTMYNIMGISELVKNSAMGSAQPNISASGIESLKFIIPFQKTISDFSSIFKNTFDIKLKNMGENQNLEILRDTILPKLISGELEVKEAMEKIS